ncbi:hypothetical protein [Pyxidicoccus xibeiensis]|uniref:hypothetical protein n=1 Tax=Pyxidicoccus xibeiensis TaxID=2906759 RepID=UPI0020A6E3C9|nr:hypothetical protein [Pyxidicoccus xibeiensis]MCP3139807.1 hypothetical protein [Pyxidicoccus xibeiensis]
MALGAPVLLLGLYVGMGARWSGDFQPVAPPVASEPVLVTTCTGGNCTSAVMSTADHQRQHRERVARKGEWVGSVFLGLASCGGVALGLGALAQRASRRR